MGEAEDARTGACAQCGAGFVRTYSHKRFCSEACRKRAEHERGIAREFRCEGCAGTFRPKRSDRTRYCSRECAFADASLIGAARRARSVKAEERASLRSEVRALRCMAGGMAASLRRQARIAGRRRRAAAPCKTCGAPLGSGALAQGVRRFCGAACYRASPGYRNAKRANRLARKALQRGVTVERVDALRVFERDGWRCHLCGGPTRRDKRGTFHDSAPELDHVVPLSKGGEHSYRNTACAHRRCNRLKSDRVLGQPSLLAA